MPYYHILVRHKNPKSTLRSILYELDLVKEEVETFAKQYEEGRVLFKGRWLGSPDIEEVEILETQDVHDSWSNVTPLTSVKDITISSRNEKAKTVARHFIKSEPRKFHENPESQLNISKDVFVVHGHDVQSLIELKKILAKLGLNPIVLHEQPSGSRTIVEKLEKYSNVGYAFIILTPDDLACKKPQADRLDQWAAEIGFFADRDMEMPKDRKEEIVRVLRSLKVRARQNVVLEFGYFIGLLGRDRVCCLHKGDVELPSDMHGIVYLSFEKSVEEIRLKIIKELKEAGYEV